MDRPMMSAQGSIKKPPGYTKLLKTVHTDQVAKLQAKNQQECELLEDIRNFMKQRSSAEKSYAESLIKISGTYLSKKIPPVAEVAKEDGNSDQCSVWQVWRCILDETEKIAKARLAACEVFQQQISEDAKIVKMSKSQHCRKHLDHLKAVQVELQEQVQSLERAKKTYVDEEQEAHGIRDKAKEAEEKLKKKKGGLFTSVSSLQKTSQKLGSRRNLCDEKSASARNEYILALAASNSHQNRYFHTDLQETLGLLEANVYEKIADYFSLLSRTELITWTAANSSYTKIRDQTSTMTRDHNLNCYLTCYPVLKQHITYEFEPVEDDPIRNILKDAGSMDVWKEAEKWVACQIKEKRKIPKLQQKLDMYSTLKEAGNKVDPSDPNGPDLDTKIDETKTEIRKAQTSKLKAEARIECLREGGVNIEEFYEKFDAKDSLDMPRTNSQLSLSRASPAKFSDNTESEHSDPFESDHDARSRSDSAAADNAGFEYKDSDEEDEQAIPAQAQIFQASAQAQILQASAQAQSWNDPLAVDWGDEESNAADVTVVEKQDTVENTPPSGLMPTNFPVRCIALYNYEGQNPDELSITENEELEAISEGDGDGWIRARNYKGEEGFIPQNYVALDNESLQPTDTLQQQVSFSSVDYTYSESGADTAVHVPEIPDAPPTEPPSISIEVTPMNGYIPSLANDSLVATHCRALYDYEATSPEEVSFFEGQIILILRRQVNDVDDGWWEGKLEDGTVGIFPSLMVEECDENGEPLNPLMEEDEEVDTGAPPCYTPPEIPTFLLPPDKVIVTQPTPETEQYMGDNFTNQYEDETDQSVPEVLENEASDKPTEETEDTVPAASILITAATPSLEGPNDECWEVQYSATEPATEPVEEQQEEITNAKEIPEDGNTNMVPEKPVSENANPVPELEIEEPEVTKPDVSEVDSAAIKVTFDESETESQVTQESDQSRSLSFELDPEKLQKLETLNESYA